MNELTVKTVVFLSNYFNHHQKPFCDAMYSKLGKGFLFIETESMDDERKKLGWAMDNYPNYVITLEEFSQSFPKYKTIILQADAVIQGSAPYELVRQRIMNNKLVFRYSERPLKKSFELWKYPVRFLRWHKQYPRRKRVYLLCASAFASSDYKKFAMFKERCYKWGYFPETKEYPDVNKLIDGKKQNSLIWVARFIDWKHPEIAVEIGKRLKRDGYSFELNMIGNGELESEIRNRITAEDLDDCVHMLGSMQPKQVREHMERSEIFLFTSDRQEGWGAVLNESMNSACAVVASNAIGSAPFLIEDGKNGLIYKDGDLDDLYRKIKWLIDNETERCKMSKMACTTIVEQWNAPNAADRLLGIIEKIQNNDAVFYETGICSNAGK